MDHCRHIKFNQFFIEWIPVTVAQTRSDQYPPVGSGLRLQPIKPILVTHRQVPAMLAVRSVPALRQLTDRNEILREQITHPADEVILLFRPYARRAGITDMVSHPVCPRRKNGQISAAFLLQFQLIAGD